MKEKFNTNYVTSEVDLPRNNVKQLSALHDMPMIYNHPSHGMISVEILGIFSDGPTIRYHAHLVKGIGFKICNTFAQALEHIGVEF